MSGPKYPIANIPDRIEEHVKSATIFDRDDPDSVFNRTIGALHEAVLRAEKNKTALRNMRLHPKAIREELKPDPRDARLRVGFWDEYARAVDRDTHMRIEYIPGGVCALEIFLEYISDPEKMGYLLNAPTSYMKNAEDILNTAMDRLRDIMDLPLVDSKGKVQTAVISGILKAAEMLDRRVRGAVMQKVAIHQHTTSGGNVAEIGGELAQDQLIELEKQISDVRKKMAEKYALIPSHSTSGDVIVEKAQDGEET